MSILEEPRESTALTAGTAPISPQLAVVLEEGTERDLGVHEFVGHAGRLALALLLGGFGWMFTFGATSAVLTPQTVTDLVGESHQVLWLGIVTVISGIFGLVANIAFGGLSDRTRSRFGRRNPWILGGAVAACLGFLVTPLATTILGFLAVLIFLNVVTNAHIAPLIAVVPDRVPFASRGAMSALYGTGMLLGSVLGQIVGAGYINDPGAGFQLCGIVLLVAAVAVVLLAPDTSARELPASVTSFRRAFAFPRNAPDFRWALLGRLLLMISYFTVSSYQLYLLRTYIGLSKDLAATTIGIVGLTAAVGALVGSTLSGPLSDRLARRKVLVIASSLLIAVSALPPFLWASGFAVVIGAAIAGLGFGVYLAVDTALMTEVLPSHRDRAKDMGILNISNTGGQIIAPGIASLVVGLTDYRMLYLVGFLVAVASAFCITPIRGVR